MCRSVERMTGEQADAESKYSPQIVQWDKESQERSAPASLVAEVTRAYSQPQCRMFLRQQLVILRGAATILNIFYFLYTKIDKAEMKNNRQGTMTRGYWKRRRAIITLPDRRLRCPRRLVATMARIIHGKVIS